MHAYVIAAKKKFPTQWWVDSCRVNVDGVTGNLAKSQDSKRKLKGGLLKSLRGGVALLSVQVGNLSKIVNRLILS